METTETGYCSQQIIVESNKEHVNEHYDPIQMLEKMSFYVDQNNIEDYRYSINFIKRYGISELSDFHKNLLINEHFRLFKNEHIIKQSGYNISSRQLYQSFILSKWGKVLFELDKKLTSDVNLCHACQKHGLETKRISSGNVWCNIGFGVNDSGIFFGAENIYLEKNYTKTYWPNTENNKNNIFKRTLKVKSGDIIHFSPNEGITNFRIISDVSYITSIELYVNDNYIITKLANPYYTFSRNKPLELLPNLYTDKSNINNILPYIEFHKPQLIAYTDFLYKDLNIEFEIDVYDIPSVESSEFSIKEYEYFKYKVNTCNHTYELQLSHPTISLDIYINGLNANIDNIELSVLPDKNNKEDETLIFLFKFIKNNHWNITYEFNNDKNETFNFARVFKSYIKIIGEGYTSFDFIQTHTNLARIMGGMIGHAFN